MSVHSEDYPEVEEMTKNKVSYVKIEKASNGYIVSWDEMDEGKKNSMEHMGSTSKKKLFSMKEDEMAWKYFVMYKKSEVEYDYDQKMNTHSSVHY